MSKPKETKKDDTIYPKKIVIAENGSDCVETVSSDTFRKTIIRQFGNDVVKLAVDQLRGEFQEMAVEAGRQGAMMAIHGDDVMELEMKVEEAVKELTKLKTEKEELEYQLRQEKTTNKDLEERIRKLEDRIRKQATRIRDMKRKINDLKEAENTRYKTENELRSENKKLMEQISTLKGRLLVKESAGNIAKDELPKLRAKITKLENQLEQNNGRRR